MRFEEGGSRIDDLKLILGRVAFATSLFDHDGISVRVSHVIQEDKRPYGTYADLLNSPVHEQPGKRRQYHERATSCTAIAARPV